MDKVERMKEIDPNNLLDPVYPYCFGYKPPRNRWDYFNISLWVFAILWLLFLFLNGYITIGV